MGLFQSFDICASGMSSQRLRMDTIAQNIANVNTTRTAEGKPYRRKIVTFEERQLNPASFSDTLKYVQSFKGNGVRVSAIREDTTTDPVREYDPSNPDADADGYVTYPNVNTVTEMTNLIDSSRAYEANVTAFNAVKSMAQTGINVGNS